MKMKKNAAIRYWNKSRDVPASDWAWQITNNEDTICGASAFKTRFCAERMFRIALF
jgi:hypothetical protein